VLQAELLLTALCEAEVSFIMIGGMAAVAQGSSYVTADLDIFYERQNPNYAKFTAALRQFNPRLRGVDPGLPFVLDEGALRSGMNFTLTTDAGDLDRLGEIAGFASFHDAKAQSEEIELFQQRIWVLTLDGLRHSKEATGRPKDLRLLPEIKALKALRDTEPNKDR
jgi:hypothetical protein